MFMAGKWKRALACLLAVAALAVGGRYVLTCPLPFSPWLWQRFDGLRGRMLDDLLEEHLSAGMTRDEVCALLGGSENSLRFPYDYQEETYEVLRETYYVQDNGVFDADFLSLYYAEQDGNYVYKAHRLETVDLF